MIEVPPLFSSRMGRTEPRRVVAIATGQLLRPDQLGEEDPNDVHPVAWDLPDWREHMWRCRHRTDLLTLSGGAMCEPLLRCACLGSFFPGEGSDREDRRCLQRATQEDRLCDACREYCKSGHCDSPRCADLPVRFAQAGH